MSEQNKDYKAGSVAIPRVAVLMSTYNGEKYIREQIESILTQEGVVTKLYVRDDNSSDQTLKILKEYKESGKLKIISAKQNIGPGRSFMRLIYAVSKHEDFDYMAFADQDDIWLPRKIYAAVEKLKDAGEMPALYGSNQTLYQNGKEEKLRFYCPQDTSLEHHISRNEISGCTMVMNKTLVTKIISHPYPPVNIIDFRIHDAWVALVAILTGTFIYDPNSYILYRIHENNTVGIKKISTKERFNRLLLKGNNGKCRANLRSNTAKILLKYYPDVDKKHRAVLEKYAYYRKNMKCKLVLMRDKKIIQATGENSMIFRLKILMNFV